MKRVLNPGEKKVHKFTVSADDIAKFNEQVVHKVCSTFALAREIEWSTRLFVLEILDPDEEGIGTRLTIDHISPAFENEQVEIQAEVKSFDKNELICSYKVLINNRLVAKGDTGQKILKKSRIREIFSNFG